MITLVTPHFTCIKFGNVPRLYMETTHPDYDKLMGLDYAAISNKPGLQEMDICNYFTFTMGEARGNKFLALFEAKFDSSEFSFYCEKDEKKPVIHFEWFRGYKFSDEQMLESRLKRIELEAIPDFINKLLQL